MAEQPRRRSFDEVLNDSLVQWTKRFERALEEQRQVIGNEAQERVSDIESATRGQLAELEQLAAEKTAELQQIAVDYRDANERVLAERSAEIEQATRQQVDELMSGIASTFDEFAEKRLGELEDTLRLKLDAFRRESIEETNRVRTATADHLDETRAIAKTETRRLEEQAAATQDELRRVVVKETAAFDELARERVSELRDLLGDQTELLGEFTGTHDAAMTQLDEVRTFTKETMARLSRLNDAVARQIRENEASAAGAAQQLKQASATELNSIQQRAMALDELARKHIADVERHAGKLLEAESSTAEGLRAFEGQLESRRAEIEALANDRISALTDAVQRAEVAAAQRITQLGERTSAKIEEQIGELEAANAAIRSELRDARRADDSAAATMDARMATLVETIAAVQVALDQIADRVEELEPVANAPARGVEEPLPTAEPEGPVPTEERLPAEEPLPPRPDVATTPDLSTPDLRDW